MVDTQNQLGFWWGAQQPLADDLSVALPAEWGNAAKPDDITVVDERRAITKRSASGIFLFYGKTERKAGPVLPDATPIAIAAFLRIAFAQRETLSLDRLATRRGTVARLIAHELVTSGKAQIHAGSLADTYMRISQEVFRDDLNSAWLRTLARVPHDTEKPHNAAYQKKPVRFIPGVFLVKSVREGFRSHSETYPRFVEPRFVTTGLSLLENRDIEEFIAPRMWRLMLSLADHASAEGRSKLQVGSKVGFLETVDHLILDRIPVSPKDVTPFLNRLYDEYKQFIGSERQLPGRGDLRVNEEGIFLVIQKSDHDTRRTAPPRPKTEVFFE